MSLRNTLLSLFFSGLIYRAMGKLLMSSLHWLLTSHRLSARFFPSAFCRSTGGRLVGTLATGTVIDVHMMVCP